MKTSRRDFIKTIGVGTAVISFPGILSTRASNSEKPNIILIMSDDHAEQAISCYGSKIINTPNIDKIADEGVRFNNSFVTNSICGPSRAVMLTGKYSHLNGLRDNRDEFDGSQLTFPKLLQKNGYQTFIIGKWHLKTEPTGFDSWKILYGQGQYYNPLLNENGDSHEHIGYTTDIITELSIDQLNCRDKSKPFCLLIHHKAPHRNWMPSPKYFNEFDDVDIPLPETFYDDYSSRNAAKNADMRVDDMYLTFDLKLKKENIESETGSGGSRVFAEKAVENWELTYERMTEDQKREWDSYYDKINKEYKEKKLEGDELLRWKYQRYIKDYLRCILSVDESVGEVLNYLNENGLSENTLVIYTSDQGFYLGEHGWYDKRFMYEESLSMPLLMKYPNKIKKGQVINELTMNLDFAPTILDYAGIKIPKEMQGESLKPLMSGEENQSWRDSIYYHYYEYPHGWHNVRKHYGIRTDRYKLIHYYDVPDEWELFDLENDPNELKNIYSVAGNEKLIMELKEELSKLQQKYKDIDFN